MRATIKLQISLTLLVLAFTVLTPSASAQINDPRTDGDVDPNTQILYHNGPIMTGTPGVYLIWYGCWGSNCGKSGDPNVQLIVSDFLSNVGGSPYFQINAMYPNGYGGAPSGAVLYGGSVVDHYSHGSELSASDLQEIVRDQIESNGLPQDPGGIYVVIASADVGSAATGFCVPGSHPHHGVVEALGVASTYAFVGNAARCPLVEASQFVSWRGQMLPTPNNNLAADAMASTLAHVLSTVITNPFGGAWYDMYGLENADKCEGQFGDTYFTPNGARANIRLGDYDYLLQLNWVNEGPGHCAINSSM